MKRISSYAVFYLGEWHIASPVGVEAFGKDAARNLAVPPRTPVWVSKDGAFLCNVGQEQSALELKTPAGAAYAVGDRVEVKFHSSDHVEYWRPARLLSVAPHFIVQYDNGDKHQLHRDIQKRKV